MTAARGLVLYTTMLGGASFVRLLSPSSGGGTAAPVKPFLSAHHGASPLCLQVGVSIVASRVCVTIFEFQDDVYNPPLRPSKQSEAVRNMRLQDVVGYGDSSWYSPTATTCMKPVAELVAARQAWKNHSLDSLKNCFLCQLISRRTFDPSANTTLVAIQHRSVSLPSNGSCSRVVGVLKCSPEREITMLACIKG